MLSQSQEVIISSKLDVQPDKNLNKTKLCCSGRFRFNLLFLSLAAGIPIIPLFLNSTLIFMIFNLYYSMWWIIFTINYIINQNRIKSKYLCNRVISQEEINTKEEKMPLGYNIIFCCYFYKEKLDLLDQAISRISNLDHFKDFLVIIAVEEKTPEKDEKIKFMSEKYKSSFKNLIFTIHPSGVKGEIPGKCSNANYAIRSFSNYIKDFDPKKTLITGFDVDTCFHKNYINCLLNTVKEVTDIKEENLHSTVFQPALYYNWGLDKVSCFSRITGIIRNAMMLGALVPFNINVMSVYCATLELYIRGDYTHTFYQMEDIICYIRWMIKSKNSMKIKLIPSPTLSGPTSGDHWFECFYEWMRQIKRWSIGSCEVFHYFTIKVKHINCCDIIKWGFNYLNYYSGFMCSQGLLVITTIIFVTVLRDEKDKLNSYYLLIPLGIYYLCALFIFIFNSCASNGILKDFHEPEDIFIIRNFLHYLISYLALFLHCLIALVGFLEMLIKGKESCDHCPSEKDNLEEIANKETESLKK